MGWFSFDGFPKYGFSIKKWFPKIWFLNQNLVNYMFPIRQVHLVDIQSLIPANVYQLLIPAVSEQS